MMNLLLAVIYLAFISLGLPGGLLGSAWPIMSGGLHVPLSWAGGISMTISAGTIISALLSDRLTLRFGAGRVTAFSVALTAAALVAPVMLGFGCAPINPAVVHMTPRLFGAVYTMTMIGWEIAVIAVATLVSPALFAVFSATVAWRPCRGTWRVSRRLAYWPPSFS